MIVFDREVLRDTADAHDHLQPGQDRHHPHAPAVAHVPELVVDINPQQATEGRLHFHVLSLNVAALHIVRAAFYRVR